MPEILAKDLPIEFSLFLNYTKSIRFEDKPDYNYLKRIFKELFFKMGFQMDFVYDWNLNKPKRSEGSTTSVRRAAIKRNK